MQFASEVARTLFYQLPIGKQVEFSRLEQLVAKGGCDMTITAVMAVDGKLHVSVDIGSEFVLRSASDD